MRHVVGPRREIGLRTIFNILGPLTNPAGASVQVLGVYREDLTETMAEALRRLGSKSAFVVYGEGSYDEISITGRTIVTRLRGDEIVTTSLTPEDVGLKRVSPEEIRGGDASRNAAIVLEVLGGVKNGRRDMVLMNAGAVLVAADRAQTLKEGVEMAADAIDSGRAMGKLRDLIATAGFPNRFL